MADLGYYYSSMAGDHLTTTGHTGVPARFQHKSDTKNYHSTRKKYFSILDNSFVSIDKKAKKRVVYASNLTGSMAQCGQKFISTGKLFQQTDGSLIRLKTGICSTLRSNQLDYTASALHTHNNNNNNTIIMFYPGYIGYDQFFYKQEKNAGMFIQPVCFVFLRKYLPQFSRECVSPMLAKINLQVYYLPLGKCFTIIRL
ncbi:hypothetical protein T4B_7766 [Trichinella pseudospiralis]|uniref:Uncharacterized protein n=1 Tax=Trichinella pseudospiralis TaxID=6337 RepID=A0A0V1KAE4_TRIPS|nr:hypothetical protein T4A_1617 [Trichinella pseudospiralis]KRZ32765.1 hypothetical protein T4B_7766 [Trichinella pseudospiralis]KRZ43893.1 hypothetical protein T4C_459 [Trichinella pseudospiralis]